jgi:ubiquitin-like domain-containing CTD phosphatase 1
VNDPNRNMAAPLEVEVSFSGSKHVLALPPTATVGDLRAAVEAACCVAAARQKLVGLPPGADSTPLASLPLKLPRHKLMLVGTRDDALARARAAAAEAAAEAAAAVTDDLSGEGEEEDEDDDGVLLGADGSDAWLSQAVHAERVARRVSTYKPKMLAGFRPGKKGVVVLDIDYTLIDHRTVVERPADMARPYLHEFLARTYAAGFDLVIWSATSMSWIDVKMREMGVTSSPAYQVAAFVDGGAMVPVDHPRYGRVNVKPLPVLWRLWEGECSPSSTIMLDDLRRNFLLNPRHGLRIKACRDLRNTRASDRELLHLSEYLEAIARLPVAEWPGLEHSEWRRFLADRGYRAALEDDRAQRRAEEGGGGGR